MRGPRRTSQPQSGTPIDWDNPITESLTFCFDGLALGDLVSGAHLTAVGTKAGIAAPTVNSPGNIPCLSRGFDTSSGVGTTDHIVCGPRQLLAPLTSLSVWLLAHSAGGSNLARLYDQGTATAAIQTVFFSAANTLQYARNFTATSGLWTMPAASLTYNRWHHLCIVHDATSTANVPQFYLDGASVTTTTTTTPVGSLVANSNPFWIGNRPVDSARVWDGAMGPFQIWQRLLSAAEVNALYLDTWQVFKPAPRRLGRVISSGAVYSDTLTEAGSAADSIAAAATFPNTFTEAGSAADALATAVTLVDALSEAGSAADTIAAAATFANTLSEVASASEVVAAAATLAAALTEAGTAADSLISAVTMANALTESGSAADALASALIAVAALSEAAAAVDALTSAWTTNAALTEAASATDFVTTGSLYIEALAEAGSASDSLNSAVTFANLLDEAGTAADALNAALTALNALAEAATAADSLATTASLTAAITETASAIDALATQVVFAGNALIEAGVATDAVVGTVSSALGIILGAIRLEFAPYERRIAISGDARRISGMPRSARVISDGNPGRRIAGATYGRRISLH